MLNTSNEHWIKDHWRPAAAWVYLVINIFDFIIFPSITYLYAFYTKTDHSSWNPLTIQGGGLFHIAFGSIVTATSWGRTKEKLNDGKIKEDPPL